MTDDYLPEKKIMTITEIHYHLDIVTCIYMQTCTLSTVIMKYLPTKMRINYPRNVRQFRVLAADDGILLVDFSFYMTFRNRQLFKGIFRLLLGHSIQFQSSHSDVINMWLTKSSVIGSILKLDLYMNYLRKITRILKLFVASLASDQWPCICTI